MGAEMSAWFWRVAHFDFTPFIDIHRLRIYSRFGGSIGHDPHLLYTVSAIQVLALCDSLQKADFDKIASYIRQLQQPDGSFWGDIWGEIDTRFSYCALLALSIMGRLNDENINVIKAAEFVNRYDVWSPCALLTYINYSWMQLQKFRWWIRSCTRCRISRRPNILLRGSIVLV